MTIKEVQFRRVYNMGNYQSMAIELTASVDEEEDVQEVLGSLRKECDKYRKAEEV